MPLVVRVAFVATLLAAAAACSPPRDTVEKSTDVHTTAPPEDYVHVTKRAHAVIALAEARGMSDADAKRTVESWADAFEACAMRLESEGKLAEGAARVVAILDDSGAVAGTNVKTSEGASTIVTTLQCLLAPIKATPFAPGKSDGGTRGIAIEAKWRPSGSTRPPPISPSEARDGGAD